MNNIEPGQIFAALFLALIVVTALLSAGRHGLAKTVKQASIWIGIFVLTFMGFGIWTDINSSSAGFQAVSAKAGQIIVPRSRDGHYHLVLNVNDQDIAFVVDTGASGIVLTQQDAAKIGLSAEQLRYFGRANTANGQVRTAPVTLDKITVAGVTDRNVPAYVNEGEQFQSLLGMSYLQRWQQLEIKNGRLILTR